jgi:outer membrane protein assembly factor BamB
MRRSVTFVAALILGLIVSVTAAALPVNRAWIARFNGGPMSLDEAEAVAISSQGGRIYVGGISEGRGGLAVVAYRYSGVVAWRSARFEPPPGYEVTDVSDIVVSTDNRYVVLTADLIGIPSRMAAVGFDANTGEILWTWMRTPGASQGFPVGVAAGPNRVFVIGAAGMRDSDWYVAALRPASGALVWEHRVDDPQGATDTDSVVYRGGRVFVTGSAAMSDRDAMRVVAYAASDGARLWSDTFTGATYGTIAGVSEDGSRLIVTGGWAVVVYGTRTGARTRVERLNPSWDGAITDVTINRSATRIYFTGYSWSGSPGTLTAAYDLGTARRKWKTSIGNGGGVAIVASPSSAEVYVSAYTEESAMAWQTTAFDRRTGVVLWSDIYRGPLHQQGFPRAMAVAPYGSRVYVVGYASSSTGSDFATMAYSTA